MPFVKGQPRPPNAGRKKGTLNKKTIQRIAREDAAKLLEAKLLANDLPIDLMLRIMRDPTQDMHTRLAAARAAAPYCHPQLAAVQHRLVGPDGNAIVLGFSPRPYAMAALAAATSKGWRIAPTCTCVHTPPRAVRTLRSLSFCAMPRGEASRRAGCGAPSWGAVGIFSPSRY
jgi:hypothetical protein